MRLKMKKISTILFIYKNKQNETIKINRRGLDSGRRRWNDVGAKPFHGEQRRVGGRSDDDDDRRTYVGDRKRVDNFVDVYYVGV